MPAKSVTAGRAPGRIMPCAPVQLGGRGIEEMRDVAFLAAAELDPDRVDQNQPVELAMPAGRDLGGDPAAERKADQGRAFGRNRVEHAQIDMNEIVHRIEITRARRVAEPRVRRGNDFPMFSEQIEKSRPRADVVDAVDENQCRRVGGLAFRCSTSSSSGPMARRPSVADDACSTAAVIARPPRPAVPPIQSPRGRSAAVPEVGAGRIWQRARSLLPPPHA